MKHLQRSPLRALLMLLLCAALCFSILHLPQAVPQRQQTDPASRELLSDSSLLYDAESISSVDDAKINTSSPTPEDAPADPAEPDDAPPPEEPDDTPTGTVTPDRNGDIASQDPGRNNIGDLLDIAENGGGSGGQTPDRQPGSEASSAEAGDPDRYFETSIVDGDIVDYQNYTFTIRHLKSALQVRGLSVSVNTAAYSYSPASSTVLIRLNEGENRIVVRAMYDDGEQSITATRTYTLTYALPGETMVVAYRTADGVSLQQLHSTDTAVLRFTAYGLRDGKHLRPAVRLNGKTLSGSGENFTAALEFGDNTIEITAADRSASVTERYTIRYQTEHFQILTSFSDTVIDNDTRQPQHISEELPIYLDDETFRFRFYLNQETGREQIRQVRYDDKLLSVGADGWYTVQVDTRAPKYLLIRYLDADGAAQSYKWTVRFHRNPEATPPDRYPTISATVEIGNTITNLDSGMVLKNPDIITLVDARSWNNEQLYYNHITVSVNGQRVPYHCSQSGATFGYETYLTREGKNTITITVTDEDGYSVTRSWDIYYETGDITVTVSIEATTVGLGYLLPPTQVTVPGGTDVMQIVLDLLEANGFGYDASTDYLASIRKNGICEGFSIDPELMELILTDGMDATGSGRNPQPNSPDSLGEFDFYRWSGWMFSYNGRYPGYSMSACKPQDGAVIRLRYTLALGKDIGGFSAEVGGGYGSLNGNYYKEW